MDLQVPQITWPAPVLRRQVTEIKGYKNHSSFMSPWQTFPQSQVGVDYLTDTPGVFLYNISYVYICIYFFFTSHILVTFVCVILIVWLRKTIMQLNIFLPMWYPYRHFENIIPVGNLTHFLALNIHSIWAKLRGHLTITSPKCCHKLHYILSSLDWQVPTCSSTTMPQWISSSAG